MTIGRMLGWLVIPLVALLAGMPVGRAQTTVRMVPRADLKILDPVWPSAQITQIHAYLVYDTLFGVDGQQRPPPQMVEAWQRSADGLTWTFTLRPGLMFHAGTPVTAEDAVLSIKRWS